MQGIQTQHKRAKRHSEAWILGTGISSLASAFYLVTKTDIRPCNIHVLDQHASLEQATHKNGDSLNGYDQFAACLPVPVGSPIKELLSAIPSGEREGRSLLDDIHVLEANRLAANGRDRTHFLKCENGSMQRIPVESLNLGCRYRTNLARFLLRKERSLSKSRIRDLFPNGFFETAFWAVWSAQFGFQPWHCAAEFRRAIRQYLSDLHSLSILSCLDITGYYQYEAIYLPIYSFILSYGVDVQFGTFVKDIEMIGNNDQRTITGFHLTHDGREKHQTIGSQDMVIVNLGSTVSGSATGTNDIAPFWHSIEPDETLDQNWSVWLDLGNKHHNFGNPYTFCTRQPESMLESFTITTRDITFFDNLSQRSDCGSNSGAFIFVRGSSWRLNICIPSQPVFPNQPQDVRVLWGFAHSPGCQGDYVNKTMLQSSGTEILRELLGHLNLNHQLPISLTVTIPRAMPRMSTLLLTRALSDRPHTIPKGVSNIGLVGQFVEIPRRTCVDVSYGICSAQIAVASLAGLPAPPVNSSISTVSAILKILFWR